MNEAVCCVAGAQGERESVEWLVLAERRRKAAAATARLPRLQLWSWRAGGTRPDSDLEGRQVVVIRFARSLKSAAERKTSPKNTIFSGFANIPRPHKPPIYIHTLLPPANMASLNTSTNGPSIKSSYAGVINSAAPSGPAAASPTYGQWAVFSVSAPLVNAFQQDNYGKESILKVQSTGGMSSHFLQVPTCPVC